LSVSKAKHAPDFDLVAHIGLREENAEDQPKSALALLAAAHEIV
jgi:hypothetical protein